MSQQRLPDVDYKAFADEIFALRDEIKAELGPRDIRHLRSLVWRNRIVTVLGYATAWFFPNPISAFLIAAGLSGRWMVMHHVGHGGYDKVPNMPKRFHSRRYALGWRRFVDWFDWIYPPAWNHEHNVLHHYHTGEENDPDLVEDHAEFFRKANWPLPMKYALTLVLALTWKFTYYAPNTLRALEQNCRNRPSGDLLGVAWDNVFNPMCKRVWRLWLVCYIPYISVGFVLIPLCFLPLGWKAVASVFLTRVLAEFLTNLHTFCIIAPNHAGDDIYRYETHFAGRDEFAVNQVIGSANYFCGTEPIDYAQGYLNYQIEHHLYPAMPILKYREYQPRVRELCEKHGVPYVQESVWARVRKLVDILVGNTSMLWLRENDGESKPPAGPESDAARTEPALALK